MVSSKDVAKRAGVSQSTVSRVLNDSPSVSKDNIEKVTKAMKDLNYRPNSIARSLVSKQTKTLALISGPLHNPFFVETTTSIVNYANEKGYKMNVFFENMGDNMSVYESVLSMQLDGLILSSIFMDDPIYEELQSLNIPFVMFNRKHNKGGNFVEIDNEKAGKMAADHLIDLGHEKIGYIGGPLYTSTFYGRYTGFRKEIEKRTALDQALIHETDTSEEAVREAVLKMMGRKHKPTAIFAATDAIAIFAIDTLKELGYGIPEDISICGMDNVRMARHHAFELTTIGHETDKNLGRLGIEHLIELIEDSDDPKEQVRITMDPILYQRKTTCKL
ncbi:LacI family DNA-binding transcriptional regulator [Alteribacillus bidgolensis]|uniref:Transcriptional regulator, LacI family n=1 Tax=Alteribacillus bidgolensis TaxID=930129 RepID=A0A1G8HGT9_9BACI|nr:LacI family DNA-binding transcriptional regulator [Alteribacillus bidgolensis]SDI05894.1 transcriptional regulator, LacI family [Alteribacillus bidgolensis]